MNDWHECKTGTFWEKEPAREESKGEVDGGGKHDQSTSYACMKIK
jgi:hypothetical protein